MADRLRAVVIDDEPLSRRAMRQLLDLQPAVDVVGEFEGVDAYAAAAPPCDVLFLDIEMPRRSGLDFVTATAGTAGPVVVFVTAHEAYAVAAFDSVAVDYLLKPVPRARIARALERVRTALAARAAGGSARSAAPASLVARIGTRDVVVRLAEVSAVRAEGVYASLLVGGRRHLVRRSLDALARLLGDDDFVRVHRSWLVRRSAISEVRSARGGRGRLLVLSTGVTVPVSRRRAATLRAALHEGGAAVP